MNSWVRDVLLRCADVIRTNDMDEALVLLNQSFMVNALNIFNGIGLFEDRVELEKSELIFR